MPFLLVVAFMFSFSLSVTASGVSEKTPTYRTVIEIEDWGAVVTKVIVDLGKPIPAGSVTEDTFKVHVSRSDERMDNPLIEEGYRNVTEAYVADKDGNPIDKGRNKYAVLELEIAPTDSLGSALNYYNRFNDWVDYEYTITQKEDIVVNPGKKGTLQKLVIDKFTGETRELVDDFSTGEATYGDITLPYADFTPAKDKKKNPLIIWLHGGGEGGTDPTIPLSANKAAAFASDSVQDIYGGAYVLAPQSNTRWMDGETYYKDGTSIYEEAVFSLIQDHVANNPDIDPNRIYIGGASNGGYLTMLMIRDYPEYFAAAFPVCEGLFDYLITDQDIQHMIQTPTWFVHAKNDPTLPPQDYSLLTYDRMIEAGADNVHFSLFDDVRDTSGLYTNDDGTPYQYNGHWSWIYLYNNEATATVDGVEATIMEWMASKSK
ncbi:peptidase [Salipaludibacillus neizhouensis]|uniref:Peptidase n=1 Tax=Salipaludibacillus neizhouensis TaxID=885475 RepID=A0A3A9K7D6_9BACI|nr:peptidase [Salipaludibacillus neizhouensis]